MAGHCKGKRDCLGSWISHSGSLATQSGYKERRCNSRGSASDIVNQSLRPERLCAVTSAPGSYLPRKVKRNHDLSHSNNCALFWAEKIRMTAQENLLSKAPSGIGEVSGGCRGFGAWEVVLTSTPLLWRVIQQNPRSPEISYSQFVAARGEPTGKCLGE